MTKIKIKCFSDYFEVFEVDQYGQEEHICNFWSYDGDSYDGFVKFLDKKGFGYEVIDME